ncbi:MAG TPA: SAM-dependent chlorinase/fluorinase [Phycisphaerae bacterium]
MPSPPITLTTDFGTRDHYVAVMKGVIAQLAPQVTVVDVTHEIEPQNLVQAAFVLRQVLPWFPRGTVHVVVVDPTVGSARRILAGRYAGQIVLVPDNGIISLVHRDFRVEDLRLVEDQRHFLPSISATFHGRDIFAPVAARLASGLSLDRLGPQAAEVTVWRVARPTISEDYVLRGQIIHTDRFGNLITNIARSDLVTTYKHRRDVQIYLGAICIGPIRTSFHEVAAGEPLALIGSMELLEIAINQGSAATHFQPAPQLEVIVR